MLIKDKYTPKYFNEYIINKNIINTYKNLGVKPLYNILINGTHGTGKYTLAKSILCEIYGESVYNLKKNSLNLQNKNNNKTKYHKRKTFLLTHNNEFLHLQFLTP